MEGRLAGGGEVGFSGVDWPSGGWALSQVLGMCKQTRAEKRVGFGASQAVGTKV